MTVLLAALTTTTALAATPSPAGPTAEPTAAPTANPTQAPTNPAPPTERPNTGATPAPASTPTPTSSGIGTGLPVWLWLVIIIAALALLSSYLLGRDRGRRPPPRY